LPFPLAVTSRGLNSRYRVSCRQDEDDDRKTDAEGAYVKYFVDPSFTDSSAAQKRFTQEIEHEILWESYASSYDKVVGRMPYYGAALDRHLRFLNLNRVASLADLGAGTGNLTIRAARRGINVLAVDTSPSRAMLAYLVRKLGAEPAANRVQVRQQSAESLKQIADGTYDAVSVLLAFFDMEHPVQAFWEALRILAPGGAIAITEPRACFKMDPILRFCRGYLLRHKLLTKLSTDFRRVFEANGAIDPATRASRSPLRIEHIHRALAAGGFANLRQVDSHSVTAGP
jgi:ubiquinone/menaquinone biosynthesis C-methylase UbiE